MSSKRRLRLAVYATGTALAFVGCRPGGLDASDANLLGRIYSSGRARFEQQAISLTVERGGLLRLITTGRLRVTEGEGAATGVAVVACNSEPMTLVRPVMTTSDGTVLDAAAIEVSVNSGIRCLTVEFALPPASSPPPAGSSGVRPLSIEAVLVSPAFTSSTAILVPAGQGRGLVTMTLSLPGGTRVSEAAIHTLSDDDRFVLTPVPSSLSPDAVQLVGTLESNQPGLLELSPVTFSTPGPLRAALRRWRGGLIVSAFLCCAVAFIFFSLLRFSDGMDRLRHRYGRRLSDILEFEELLKKLFGESYGSAHEKDLRAKEYVLDQYERDRTRLLHSLRWTRPWVYARLGDRRAIATLVFVGLTFLALIAAVVAKVVSPQSEPSTPTAVTVTLGELELKIDAASIDRDAVPVSANFYAFVDRVGAPGSFEIRTRPSVKVTKIELKPLGGAPLESSGSDTRVSGNVPGTDAPFAAFAVFRAVANGHPGEIRPVQATNSYFEAVQSGRLVQAQLTLSGVVRQDRWAAGNWLHWFPLDTTMIEVPLSFSNGVVLNSAAVVKPRNRHTTLTVSPLDLREIDKDDVLLLTSRIPRDRLVIPRNSNIVLTTTSRRSRLQQVWLLIGVPIVLLASAYGLRYVALLPKRSSLDTIVGSLGLFGLSGSIYAAVSAREPGLPSPLAGEGLSVFDMVYGTLAVLLAAALIREFIKRSSKKNPTKK